MKYELNLSKYSTRTYDACICMRTVLLFIVHETILKYFWSDILFSIFVCMRDIKIWHCHRNRWPADLALAAAIYAYRRFANKMSDHSCFWPSAKSDAIKYCFSAMLAPIETRRVGRHFVRLSDRFGKNAAYIFNNDANRFRYRKGMLDEMNFTMRGKARRFSYFLSCCVFFFLFSFFLFVLWVHSYKYVYTVM